MITIFIIVFFGVIIFRFSQAMVVWALASLAWVEPSSLRAKLPSPANALRGDGPFGYDHLQLLNVLRHFPPASS